MTERCSRSISKLAPWSTRPRIAPGRMSLAKNVAKVTEALPRAVITWDKAARIRRYEEIWANPKSVVHRLPDHYKKRFWDNVLRDAAPVHYRPPTSRYAWDEKRLVMVEQEDNPIRGIHPPEADAGLWGGEGVVKGYRESRPYTKKKILARHWVPKLWFPELRDVVLYSEILDAHMKIQVTERALRLIDQHFGLDYYLLETPEIDLDSRLANKLKREMLLALAHENYYPDDDERRDYIRQKYAKFRISEEEAKWVGLSLNEAARLQQDLEDAAEAIPLKNTFADELRKSLAGGTDVKADEEQYAPKFEESKFGEKLFGQVMRPLEQRLKK
ncbi:unnamed protein product, partial [Mesorhabditis spiculigera]